jgi:hypothetical protein
MSPFSRAGAWGFYAHQKINYYAVFLLPPEMMVLYKPHIRFLSEHAVDPDKRRYAVPDEGSRHYIDIDHYGAYPYRALPRPWKEAMARYGKDTLLRYGIVPWHIPVMLERLTRAFKTKNFSLIMKYSAEIGHYIADAHVPLHASSNHNGQLTNQKGIHGFWESRIPELLAEKEFDFFIGKAAYLEDPGNFIWARILESAAAADTVLTYERILSGRFSDDKKFAFENRDPGSGAGKTVRQYSSAFTMAYNNMLGGMVERRMRQSIFAIASFWYTAWVNAGQPNLRALATQQFTEAELSEFESLNEAWRSGSKMIGREEQ